MGNVFVMFELKNIDNDNIQIEAKEITDDSIYEITKIIKTLDTYSIDEVIFLEYKYTPYYLIGERNNPKIYYNLSQEELISKLDWLHQESIDDRRRGWSNTIDYLIIKFKVKDKSDNNLEFIKGELYALINHTDNGNSEYAKGFMDGLKKAYEIMDK